MWCFTIWPPHFLTFLSLRGVEFRVSSPWIWESSGLLQPIRDGWRDALGLPRLGPKRPCRFHLNLLTRSPSREASCQGRSVPTLRPRCWKEARAGAGVKSPWGPPVPWVQPIDLQMMLSPANIWLEPHERSPWRTAQLSPSWIPGPQNCASSPGAWPKLHTASFLYVWHLQDCGVCGSYGWSIKAGWTYCRAVSYSWPRSELAIFPVRYKGWSNIHWILLFSPYELYFWSSFLIGIEKNELANPVAIYHVSEAILISSSKDTLGSIWFL